MNSYKDNRLNFTFINLIITIGLIWIFTYIGEIGIWKYFVFILYILSELLITLSILFLLEPIAKKILFSYNREFIRKIMLKNIHNIGVMLLKGIITILILFYLFLRCSDIYDIKIPPINIYAYLSLFIILNFSLLKSCLNIKVEIPQPNEMFDTTIKSKCFMLNDNLYILLYKNMEYTWLMKEHSLIYLYSCVGWINQVEEIVDDIYIRESSCGVYSVSKDYAILQPETRSIIYFNQTDVDEITEKYFNSTGDKLIKMGNVVYFFKVPGRRYDIVNYHYMLENEIIDSKEYGIYIISINCALYNEGNNTWIHINDSPDKLDGDEYISTKDGKILIKVSKRKYKVIKIEDLTTRIQNETIILDANREACFKCERISTGNIHNFYFYLNDNEKWLTNDSKYADLIEEDSYLYLYKRKQCSLTIVNRRDISLKSLYSNIDGLFSITSESNIAAVYKADGGLIAYIHTGNKYVKYDTSNGIILSKPTDSFLFIQSSREISSIEKEVKINIGTVVIIKLSINISIVKASDIPEEITDSSAITINNLCGYISGTTSKESLENDCVNEVIERVESNENVKNKVIEYIEKMIQIYSNITRMETKTRQDINKIESAKGEIISKIENLRDHIQSEINKSIESFNYKIFEIDSRFTDTIITIPLFDKIVKKVSNITPNTLIDEITLLTDIFKQSGVDMNTIAILIKDLFGQKLPLEGITDSNYVSINYNFINSIFIYNDRQLNYTELIELYSAYINENGNIELDNFMELEQIKVI